MSAVTDTTPYVFLPHDEGMDYCRRRAWELYGDDNSALSLRHERVAWDIACFLYERISAQQPVTPEALATLSVVRYAQSVAGYYSNGRGLIRQSLAILVRLAAPYADHPDYRAEWAPLEYDR